MEVPVLIGRPLARRMRMVVVLGVRRRVVDVARGIMLAVLEAVTRAECLAQHTAAGEGAQAVERPLPRRRHALELRPRQVNEVEPQPGVRARSLLAGPKSPTTPGTEFCLAGVSAETLRMATVCLSGRRTSLSPMRTRTVGASVVP